MADTWHGPYTVLGNPHPGDGSNTSWHSQISSVFKVPGKRDLYIACADRWLPELMDIPYELYRELYEKAFRGELSDPAALTDEQKKWMALVFGDSRRNTALADYVWLPLRFHEPDAEYPQGMVTVDG